MKKAPKIGQTIWYIDVHPENPGKSTVKKARVNHIHQPIEMAGDIAYGAEFHAIEFGKCGYIRWFDVYKTEKQATIKLLSILRRHQSQLSARIIRITKERQRVLKIIASFMEEVNRTRN